MKEKEMSKLENKQMRALLTAPRERTDRWLIVWCMPFSHRMHRDFVNGPCSGLYLCPLLSLALLGRPSLAPDPSRDPV